MADPVLPDDLPAAVPASRRRVSLTSHAVWIIPLVALLVVGWLSAREWLQSGPTITIQLRNGEGVEAGRTRIKYRNVDVGQVRDVTIAPGGGVLVHAEMVRSARDRLVEGTRFWVARARVERGEVSGLGTLLSGSYIGMDPGRGDAPQREFVGLDAPPVVTTDEPGREFVLRGESLGSLEIGSAVYLRRVRVGQVLSAELDADGRQVIVRVFVRAPNDRYVTTDTRFWQASGLDVTVDAGGVRLHTESLLSVLVGGVAFGTPAGSVDAPVAEPGTHYALFANQEAAMRRADGQVSEHTAIFNESVRGLAVGAPVEFKGFVIGEVAGVDIAFDPTSRDFVFPVRLRIYRDTAATVATPDAAQETSAGRFPIEQLLSARSFERGLRAQLRTANLLTGQRYVAIDFFPELRSARGRMVAQTGQASVIPTTPDAFGEIQASLSRIARRLESVPFEELAGDLRRTLANLDRALQTTERTMSGLQSDLVPAVRHTLDEASQTARSVREVLASDAPTAQSLQGALQDVSAAADAMRHLAEALERDPQSLLRGRRDGTTALPWVAPPPPPAAPTGAQGAR